ncbi:MAG: biopolymer transporter ExbD, partial [Kangiellaceae bacterium]|nr:biopolymer transporter ExbD [Kangiellaceae bacterium]
RHGKGGLNLVSLMDIFTILVFFLLVNSSSTQQLPSSKSVELPQSTSEKIPEETLLIMVNNNDLLVQGRKIAEINQVLATDQNIIDDLKTELEFQLQQKLNLDGEAVDGGEVTIMGDRQIPYKLLKRILYTLSESNYKNISLAVMKKSEKVTGDTLKQ